MARDKMARRMTHDIDELRKIWNYDHDTGIFTWLYRPNANRLSNAQTTGRRVGTTSMRYNTVVYGGVGYCLHRVAWAFFHGTWPISEIDHINGDKTDNRIANLREATHVENEWNDGKQKNNTSGRKGVSFEKATGRWRANIGVNGKCISIGRFDTIEDAYEAYCEAGRRLHGEFFNPG